VATLNHRVPVLPLPYFPSLTQKVRYFRVLSKRLQAF
jgi:hypothetical protein